MKELRALEMNSLALVYGAFLIILLTSDFLSAGSFALAWHSPQGFSGIDLVLAILVTFIAIGLIVMGPKLFGWADHLERVFKLILSPLSYLQILLLAFLSGFIEEWFFRGFLLNHLGLVTSTLAFALAHWISIRGVWIWSILALLSGLALGMIYQNSNSLLLVSLIHSAVNAALLIRINFSATNRPGASDSGKNLFQLQ